MKRSGRSPKDFWGEVLAEMERKLSIGELRPERQSQLEGAMHAWLVRNRKVASETAVHDRARILFRSLKK